MLRMFRQLSPVNQAVVSAMLSEETNVRDQLLRETFSVVALFQTPAAAGFDCSFNDLKPEPFFIHQTKRNEHADVVAAAEVWSRSTMTGILFIFSSRMRSMRVMILSIYYVYQLESTAKSDRKPLPANVRQGVRTVAA